MLYYIILYFILLPIMTGGMPLGVVCRRIRTTGSGLLEQQ